MLIPVKSFRAAKARLAAVLSESDRSRLARGMVARVIAAARPMSTFVVCDDDDVAEFVSRHGAGVLWTPGAGLNDAVDLGVATLAARGFDHVVIAHGDLPLARDLARVVRPDEVVIVPDQRRDGTNVLARPIDVALPACYGPGSFGAHLQAAVSTRRRVTVLPDRSLAIDIDTVADQTHPAAAVEIDTILHDPGLHDTGLHDTGLHEIEPDWSGHERQ